MTNNGNGTGDLRTDFLRHREQYLPFAGIRHSTVTCEHVIDNKNVSALPLNENHFAFDRFPDVLEILDVDLAAVAEQCVEPESFFRRL